MGIGRIFSRGGALGDDTVLLSHQWSKVGSEETTPSDRNSIVYYVYIMLALRLPAVAASYYLIVFAFYTQCPTVAGVSLSSSNFAGEFRISQRRQSY